MFLPAVDRKQSAPKPDGFEQGVAMTVNNTETGYSACEPGEESTETFYSPSLNCELVRYYYRTPGGVLFSTIAPSIVVARIRRDRWLSLPSDLLQLGK
jgi:hypothetical protein